MLTQVDGRVRFDLAWKIGGDYDFWAVMGHFSQIARECANWPIIR